jgi:uncharacterized protein YdeI (YjbR/CyaY-like superfamily)
MELKIKFQTVDEYIAAAPVFFATPADFRIWLAENHDKVSELLVGYYKKSSGKPSMTWSESVDQALCFGWIDGIRRSIDSERYSIRFTPRKPKSTWSSINIRKVEVLCAEGLMQPPGLVAFNLRQESKSGIYAYENEAGTFSPEFEKIFQLNTKAWSWFQAMPRSYQKTVINWVMGAKQEPTRNKRLKELIGDSETGRKIKMLSY